MLPVHLTVLYKHPHLHYFPSTSISQNTRKRKETLNKSLNQHCERSVKGPMRLNLFTRKMHKLLSSLGQAELGKKMRDARVAPDDVKEGHFAVFAVICDEPKRFTVELTYLTNPAFLRLLEQAQEEYGFEQKGVLELPCQPEDLCKILREGRIS